MKKSQLHKIIKEELQAVKEDSAKKNLKENAVSELMIAAQESTTYKAFITRVIEDFPQLAVDIDRPAFRGFLETIYNDAKSMRESKLDITLKEDTNPELDNLVSSFVKGLAKRNGYGDQDALNAIFEAMKRLGFIDKNVDYKAAATLSEGSFSDQMTPDTKALYQEYSQKIDVLDRNAINDHDTLDKVMLNDPRVQKSSQKRLLQTALGWAITFAQQMER